MLFEPLVSILIPCFNQPHFLRRCLQSIATQTYSNVEIIIVDDVSTISYAGILENFSSLNIKRVINKNNLGAVPNMVNCIHYPVQGKYKMVFHEDDVMHPHLITKLVNAYKINNEIAWVGCRMDFFKLEDEIKFKFQETIPQFFHENIKDLVKMVIIGKTLSLASVLYNCKHTKFARFDIDFFSMLGDRQMLFELGKNYGCSYIDEDLVIAYDHAGADTRWKGLEKNHIENYYVYIKSFFPLEQFEDKDLKSAFTRAIVANCKLLPQKKGLFRFYLKCYFKKLFFLKYFVLTNKKIRNIAIKLNN